MSVVSICKNENKPIAIPPYFPMLRFRIEVDEHRSSSLSLHYRGIFGKAIFDSSCIEPISDEAPNCNQCSLSLNCTYTKLFKPSILSSSDSEDAPPPLIFNTSKRSSNYLLDILLLSDDIHLMIEVVKAAQKLKKKNTSLLIERKLGSNEWDSDIHSNAFSADHAEIPKMPDQVILSFVTPLRIRKKGRYISVDELEAEDIINAVVRRTYGLIKLYGDRETFNPTIYTKKSARITFEDKHLSWIHEEEQNRLRNIEYRGIKGVAIFPENIDPDLWPLLWLGQYLNIGKGASQGFGRYVIYNSTSL